VIGTNLPTQSESEALYTWLPNEKKLLYMDMHGEPSAYMGYGKMQGEDILIEFKSMDQKDAEYRVVIKFPKPDVMTTEISAKKDGNWVLLIGYDRNKVKSEAK
jgi:hypothetical protein